MEIEIENSDNETIEVQKEELIKWKKELKSNLSKNHYKKEEFFLISKHWFERYKKFVLNTNINLSESFKLDFEYKDNNNELFSPFTDKKIEIEDLPKIFILNKTIWKNISKEYKDLSTIISVGEFSNELLTLKVFNSIYCFIFIDVNENFRQGYLEILDTKKEDKIIKDFRAKGIYKFLNGKIIIDDNLVKGKTKEYKICIFKYFLKEAENKDFENDDKEKEVISRKRSMTFRKSISNLKEKKDELN